MEKVDRPKIPKKLYRKIEDDVTNLYIELGLTVPIDPFEIAQRLGYVVIRLSEIEFPDELLAVLDSKEGERKDGLSYFDVTQNRYVILVNDIGVKYEERNRFTVMHEIGHIRLGHKTNSLLAEMMANHYAAYALAPSVLIDYYDCDDFVDVMNIFEVSDICAYHCFRRYCNWTTITLFYESEKRLLEYYRSKKENV